MEKTIKVESMMCEKCVARVKKTLEAVDGVDEARITLDDKLAVVTLSHDVANETLISVITELGHTAEMV